MATLLEVEQVIEWLEQRRIKLGGKARKYESKKQNEKIKKISRSSFIKIIFDYQKHIKSAGSKRTWL